MHLYIRKEVRIRMITTSAAKKISQKIVGYGQDWYSVQARKKLVEILLSSVNKTTTNKEEADILGYLTLKLASFVVRDR
jgi:hypothetical protein